MKQIEWMPHQVQALQATENLNSCGYFLDMGLGKTFVGAEQMHRYGMPYNLLICQKSKVSDWVEHFQTYYACIVCDLTKKRGLKEFTDGIACLKPVVAVINYELFWRRPEIATVLSNYSFTLMLDESSLIQNRKTKRTKAILKLKPQHVILLSGTPTSGKYENLWTQAHLLGWDIKESTYNTHYVNWVRLDLLTHSVWVVNKSNPYKNVQRLKAKLREHGAVFLKTSDCLQLPLQNFQIIKVPASAKYRKFKKKKVVQVADQLLSGDTELTYRLHLRQLCGQYSQEKLEAFKDIVDSTNDRLVVFYCFTEELLWLKDQIGDRPYSLVNGSTKDLDAYENEDDSITFVQYQAGAMGLNLQKANKIIYYSLPDGRSDLFDQSLKRIHRIGQSRPCYYYLLIVEDSVEEEILQTLDLRIERTNELFREDGQHG